MAQRDSQKKSTKDLEATKRKGYGNGIWTSTGAQSIGGNAGFGSYDVYESQVLPTACDLLHAYATVDIVNCCVNLIANHMAAFAPRIRLHATTDRGQARPVSRTRKLSFKHRETLDAHYSKWVRKAVNVEEVIDHPSLTVLENPNPSQTLGKLLALTSVYLDTVGSAFWYTARPTLGGIKVIDAIEEIWAIPPQQVQVEYDDKTGEIKQYVQQTGDETIYYDPKDIIAFKATSPFDPYGAHGLSPLLSCWQAVQLLRQEQTSWQAILSNMAYPSMLIAPKDDMATITEVNAERYQKELRNIFAQGNQGGPYVVMDPLNITPLAPPPKDMSSIHLYSQIRQRFTSVYHIPMPLLDMSGTSGEATNTSRRLLQENCLKPRIVNILDTVTKHLFKNERAFFATDQIIEPDYQFELQRSMGLFQAGITTQNESRAREGLPPKAGGDKIIFELQGGGSGIGTLPSLQDKAHKPKKSKAKKVNTAKVKSITLPDPTNLVQALVDVFSRLAKEVMPDFSNEPESKAFFPIEDWTKELTETLTPILRVYYEEGASEVIGKVGGDDELRKLNNQNLDKVVREAALALADSTLNTTTLEVEAAIAELRRQLDEGISQGEANRQLSDRVRSIFTELTTRRAYLIAETESARAKQAGELMAIQDSGLEAKKTWLPDSMACDKCRALDGVSKNLDEPFAVNGTGPYAVCDHPPLHPACRCTMTYEVGDL